MKPITEYYSEEQAVTMVGKGWEPLVRRVYNAKAGMGLIVGIIGVKERYGVLRIYTDFYDKNLEDVIIEVGYESETICPQCGNPSTIMELSSGMYVNACPECKKHILEEMFKD